MARPACSSLLLRDKAAADGLIGGLSVPRTSAKSRLSEADWRRFEEAVHRFAKTLDPSSEVLFDHRVPDRETGEPRQCDVWINAKYGGHWPFTIYISCKDRRKSKRKIGGPDIDTLHAEVLARQASMGVIYTNTGFAAPAIKKAKKLNISCCRLYQREPADIPEAVWIAMYVCRPGIILKVLEKPSEWPLRAWRDVFDRPADDEESGRTVMDVMREDFLKMEQEVFDAVKTKGGPPDAWRNEYVVAEDSWDGAFAFAVYGHWKIYKAQVEGILLDGSYSFGTDTGFKGTVEGPYIDTHSSHPGEHWTETTADEMRGQSNSLGMVVYCEGFEEDLRVGVGDSEVPDPAPSGPAR